MLLACRTHTVPIGSVPAYAANQPVLTEEGYGLSLGDGGAIELSPRDDTPCLEERDPPVATPGVSSVVAVRVTDFCGSVKLHGVTRVEVGPLLRFHTRDQTIDLQARERAIDVDPRLLKAVQISGARQDEIYFAPRTGVRNQWMIVAGGAVVALNAAGALAWFLTDGLAAGDYVAVTAPLFTLWVGHSLGIGVPLIVLGARPARLPQAQQPPVPTMQVGDIGLLWNVE